MGNLKFGDVYTKDLDLVIQSEPTYNFPSKDVTTEHIPGRNGDLIIDNKCWQNTERSYSLVSVFRPGTNFITNAEKLIKFLSEKKGYQRLEDTYDPSVFRMAEFKSNGSLTNYYDKATVLNVTFNCKPQRYLKDGETPVLFNNSIATLENPTGYSALPIISISGFVHQDNKVIMVTVTNENNVVSSVSLSDLPSGDVILDSELQTAFSNQNGDINKYINLNDTNFPVLNSGSTTVEIKKYTEDNTVLDPYNVLLNSSAAACLALYKPYDSIIESKQKTFYLKSYDFLKQAVQETYEAKSFANYCLEKADNYTFISFNSVLESNRLVYEFRETYDDKPEWLTITPNGSNSLVITVGSLTSLTGYNTNMAYFMSSNDKKIRRLSTGATIGTFKTSDNVKIYLYPAVTGDSPGIAVDYSNYGVPSWLKFEIEYDNSSEHCPDKIIYKTNAAGYFYLPKTGLFGKAGWETKIANAELTTFKWENYKKAFMSSAFSTSTTASIEYYYLAEVPQYEPTYKEVLDENGNAKKDANGNVIKEVDNAVHFTVISNSDLSNITYKAKEAGYFRCNDALQSTGWRYYAVNATIGTDCGFVNTTSAPNIVYYCASKPKYTNETDFPDWLDPDPELYQTTGSDINPTTLDFKVLKAGWYRYQYIENEETKYTGWVHKNANELLGLISPCASLRGPDVGFNVYRIEGEAGTFPIKEYTYTDGDGHTIKDIGFFKSDGTEWSQNTPPAWLTVNVIPGTEADGSDTRIKFLAASNGSYKKDADTVWQTKTSGSELVESGRKDDTHVYYLSSMPSYPIYPEFNTIINRNLTNGNPESVSFTAKVAGYFKAKNQTVWKYYSIGDEICNSKISESTKIYNLEADQGSLSGLTITITPRWWCL